MAEQKKDVKTEAKRPDDAEQRTEQKPAPQPAVADSPGVAHDTAAEQTGDEGVRPVKAKTPVTSGAPEAWAIPHTPAARADREAALRHADEELGRMAREGGLPESLQEPKGKPQGGPRLMMGAGPNGSSDPWQAVAQAEARVKQMVADATEADAGGEAKARATGAPPPKGAAVHQHSISREEMQANGITDDLLTNADGLGVPRLVLLGDPEVVAAVREYMESVRLANG